MKILAIGDVVGSASIEYLARKLGAYRAANGVDLICVNGENATQGHGIVRSDADALFRAGADVITTGNHVWKWREIREYMDEVPTIIRPANYPDACPGSGCVIVDAAGARTLVMNVSGLVYMDTLSDPFDAVEKMLRDNAGRYDLAVLDVHAEATSEKAAIARAFDGRIACVWGTHTHVQTNDARILPRGTGFITDLGMTGPVDSILGIDCGVIINKFRTRMPVKFTVPAGEISASGALFTLDRSFRAVSVEAVTL